MNINLSTEMIDKILGLAIEKVSDIEHRMERENKEWTKADKKEYEDAKEVYELFAELYYQAQTEEI